MEKRIGTFYGVSVGPGDPELMTLQAVRRLENCPVIAAPQTPKGGMLALDIAKGAVELSGKTILPLRFAMSLDPAVQKAAHIEAARAVKEYLDAGQDVAMLNLGDVSVYATSAITMYLFKNRNRFNGFVNMIHKSKTDDLPLHCNHHIEICI